MVISIYFVVKVMNSELVVDLVIIEKRLIVMV